MYVPPAKIAVALPEERCVLAHLGWAGEIADFFEHSLHQLKAVLPRACMCNDREIFNTPQLERLSFVDAPANSRGGFLKIVGAR